MSERPLLHGHSEHRLDEIGQALANDDDAGAKVLCAFRGDWRWDQITDAAKDRYRYEAREIAEAFNDRTVDMHLPLVTLELGINYGGAGAPDCA